MVRLRTLQGLFNSNPIGAAGLSVCPLKNPVNLRSLSITVFQVSINAEFVSRGIYFAAN